MASGERRFHWPQITRAGVQWAVGLGIAVNEIVVRDGDPRWTALLFAATLIGLPVAEVMDRLFQKSGPGSAPGGPPGP